MRKATALREAMDERKMLTDSLDLLSKR